MGDRTNRTDGKNVVRWESGSNPISHFISSLLETCLALIISTVRENVEFRCSHAHKNVSLFSDIHSVKAVDPISMEMRVRGEASESQSEQAPRSVSCVSLSVYTK